MATRYRTLAYWNGLRSAMGQRSKSDDLRALTNLVRKQAEMIRGMSAEGVDPELVAAAHAVAKCQDKVIELAEVADFQMAGLRASPTMAKQFAEANRESSAAAARLAELRGRMSAALWRGVRGPGPGALNPFHPIGSHFLPSTPISVSALAGPCEPIAYSSGAGLALSAAAMIGSMISQARSISSLA